MTKIVAIVRFLYFRCYCCHHYHIPHQIAAHNLWSFSGILMANVPKKKIKNIFEHTSKNLTIKLILAERIQKNRHPLSTELCQYKWQKRVSQQKEKHINYPSTYFVFRSFVCDIFKRAQLCIVNGQTKSTRFWSFSIFVWFYFDHESDPLWLYCYCHV